jgi:predicted HAD superfamily phosphohydrolase
MVSETLHHSKIEGRDNIILLGDSIGDLQMSANVQHKAQLTIGFLVKHHLIKFRIMIKMHY